MDRDPPRLGLCECRRMRASARPHRSGATDGTRVSPVSLRASCGVDSPSVPPRTAFWIAAAMAWLGTLRLLRQPRDKRAAILLLWALCGALPTVLSAQAYPKRGSIAFPAIYALAAMTLASVRKEIATTR